MTVGELRYVLSELPESAADLPVMFVEEAIPRDIECVTIVRYGLTDPKTPMVLIGSTGGELPVDAPIKVFALGWKAG